MVGDDDVDGGNDTDADTIDGDAEAFTELLRSYSIGLDVLRELRLDPFRAEQVARDLRLLGKDLFSA